MSSRTPVVDHLDLGSGCLVAQRCTACAALHLDRRERCGRCGSVELAPQSLATAGAVRAFTVVHRSMPGIEVPFTSVVVDLDGGGTVRANLMDAPEDPGLLAFGHRVRMVTRAVGNDIDGTQAIAYGFLLEGQ